VITSLTSGGSAPRLPASLGYKLVDATLDRQLEAFRKSGSVKVEIDYFRKKIGEVQSPDDLVKDYRLFKFALSAFGLDSQINAQALMKKVLTQDWLDPDSTANRLVDPRYREMAQSLDFFYSKASKIHLPEFIGQMGDRYVTAEFEKSTENTNPAVRLALYFKRKAPEMDNWFQVLGDKPLYEVVRTAMQIPAAGVQTDLDRYADKLEKRIGLDNLKDPKFLDRFISRYLANYDANNASAALATVSLIQPLSRVGPAGGISLAASTILGLASRR